MNVSFDMVSMLTVLIPQMLPPGTIDTQVLVMSLEVKVRKLNNTTYRPGYVHLMFQRVGDHFRVMWNETDFLVANRLYFKEWAVTSDGEPAWCRRGVTIPIRNLQTRRRDDIDPSLGLRDFDVSVEFADFGEPMVIELGNYVPDSSRCLFTVTHYVLPGTPAPEAVPAPDPDQSPDLVIGPGLSDGPPKPNMNGDEGDVEAYGSIHDLSCGHSTAEPSDLPNVDVLPVDAEGNNVG